MKFEDIAQALVPMFDSVEENNYNPDTMIARLSPEGVPSNNHTEAVEYMKELLDMLLPDSIVVDAGSVHTGNHSHIHGWWIQFKAGG